MLEEENIRDYAKKVYDVNGNLVDEPVHQKPTTIKYIKNASLGFRLLAAILDFAIVAFFSFLVYTYVCIPVSNHVTLDNAYNDYFSYQYDSGVLVVMSNIDYCKLTGGDNCANLSESINFYSLENIYYSYSNNKYEDRLKAFYMEYLTNERKEDSILPSTSIDKKGHVTHEWRGAKNAQEKYLKHIDKDGNITMMTPKEFYTIEWFNINVYKITQTPVPADEERKLPEYPLYITSDVQKFASPNPKNLDENGVVKKEYQKVYLDDLANEYRITTNILYNQEFYQDTFSFIRSTERYCLYVSGSLGLIVFYLLIPLLFSNGETLAKKSFSLGLINKNGYTISKSQTLMRFLVLFVELWLTMFTYGISLVLCYAVVVFTKSHKGLHDYAAATVVIDMKHSVWFKDAQEEEKFNQQIDENIKNLEKYDPYEGKRIATKKKE